MKDWYGCLVLLDSHQDMATGTSELQKKSCQGELRLGALAYLGLIYFFRRVLCLGVLTEGMVRGEGL